MTLRNKIGSLAYKLYRAIPFSVQNRTAVRNFLFSALPILFRGTGHYKHWKALQVQPKSAPVNQPADTRYAEILRQQFNAAVGTQSTSAEFVPADSIYLYPEDLAIKAIAFYLPQFHPIAENDEWWGRGFTEWTNVSKAVPQFVGHYQPRLPGELGFYDLRLPEVMKRQIELAKQYGLFGFCFHHYWFGGKRLLERPVNQFLDDPSLEMPFCTCWANENWSRRWDGSENEILIGQDHSPEDDVAFIKDLERMFRDPRYIRIDGKPLLIVYRASILPDARATGERWREYCRHSGIGEIYLVAAQSFRIKDPRPYGFDAAVEFPPHNVDLPTRVDVEAIVNPDYLGRIFDYRQLAETYMSLSIEQPYTLFKTISPSWDNEARKPGKGHSFHHASPDEYARWLEKACRDTINHNSASERLVFINAWNEWGEGAYLEPDRKYGYANLDATRSVLARVSGIKTSRRIVVVAHDAFKAGAQLLSLHLVRELKHNLGFAVDMVVLGDGELMGEYEQTTRVHRLAEVDPSGEQARDLAERFYAQGTRTAIVNTTVSGLFCETLKSAGMEVIVLVHELPGIIESYGLEKHTAAIARNADHVIFAAEEVQEGFQTFTELEPEKVVIRPQGLYKTNRFRDVVDKTEVRRELREQLGIEVAAQLVLGIGHGDYRKGLDLFVQCGFDVMKHNPKAHFIWVGSTHGDYATMIADIMQDKEISDRFHFVGFSSDTDLYYAGSDLYALTSREDPFPSVVMEALEVGVPVVGFEGAGGFRKLLDRGCGRIARALDPHDFAKKISALLDEPATIRELGCRGQEIIKDEFSFRKYIFDLLELSSESLRKVSVVVPNYNYAHYLADRIKSITNQSHPIYELIILDDQSTDNSLDVLDKIKSESSIEIDVVSNETNSGSVFLQWLRGVEKATGDYVWIAEADDLCDREFLENAIKPFDDDSVVMSYSQSRQMDEEGKTIADNYLSYTSDISKTKWETEYVVEGIEEIRTSMAIKNCVPNVSAVVFRREVLLEVLSKSIDQIREFKIAGDWVTYIRLLGKGSVAYNPDPLNYHRRHQSSVTIGSSYVPHLEEILCVQKLVRDEFELSSEVQSQAKEYSQRIYEQFKLNDDIDYVVKDIRFEKYFD